MTGTQFARASEWMINGNIVEFVKANPDANRFQLVGFSLKNSLPCCIPGSLMFESLIQLADVARGSIYIHQRGMIHGDLKGVRC